MKKKKKYRPYKEEFKGGQIGPKRARRYDHSIRTVPRYSTDSDLIAIRRKREAYERLTERISILQQKCVSLYLFIFTDDIKFYSEENKNRELARLDRMDKFYFKRLIDRKMWLTFVSVVPPCYYGDQVNGQR